MIIAALAVFSFAVGFWLGIRWFSAVAQEQELRVPDGGLGPGLNHVRWITKDGITTTYINDELVDVYEQRPRRAEGGE